MENAKMPLGKVFPADCRHADILRLMIAKNVIDTLHRCMDSINNGDLDDRTDIEFIQSGTHSLMLLALSVLKEGLDTIRLLAESGWFEEIENFWKTNQIGKAEIESAMALKGQVLAIVETKSEANKFIKDSLRNNAGFHFPRKATKEFLKKSANDSVQMYKTIGTEEHWADRHLVADMAQLLMAFNGEWEDESGMQEDMNKKVEIIRDSTKCFVKMCNDYLPSHYDYRQSLIGHYCEKTDE